MVDGRYSANQTSRYIPTTEVKNGMAWEKKDSVTNMLKVVAIAARGGGNGGGGACLTQLS